MVVEVASKAIVANIEVVVVEVDSVEVVVVLVGE